MKCKEAIAWEEWIDSNEAATLRTPDICLAGSDSQYLRNRLWWAYMAGVASGKKIKKQEIKENFNKLFE